VLTLSVKNAALSYRKTGTGNNTLLLFHGFGQTHRAFDSLASSLSEKYTLYCFDLFFHGESVWREGETPLEKERWKEIMNEFLLQNSIRDFSVLGFSMGGKFAIATLEAFPNNVKEIFLLAPDGIKTSFWYSLATYPVALRNLFKSLIDHPKRFNTIATWAYRLSLIDKGVLRFVELQMNSEEKRKRVYYAWVVFRHLKFDLEKIAQLVNANSIKLILLAGHYDRIITARNMNRLLRLVNRSNFKVLEAGHNDLIDKSVGFLREFVKAA
jgi:pimeloyl-ACP methyl ester carboxylesterase